MVVGVEQRNQDATMYVGNLETRVTEEILWELFTQAGPVANVSIPRDKVTGGHSGYGFVEMRSEQDADYALRILNFVELFKLPIKVRKSSQDKRTVDVGARLFIGNLDEMVDEKMLHDTFSAFGNIIQQPVVQRDDEIGKSKGFGFINFDSFEASDLAIQCMNGQFLSSRQIVVEYAFKKEGRGERHGTEAERLLAKEMQAKMKERSAPNLRFATAPPTQPLIGMGQMPMGVHQFPPQPQMQNIQFPPQIMIGMMGPPPILPPPPTAMHGQINMHHQQQLPPWQPSMVPSAGFMGMQPQK